MLYAVLADIHSNLEALTTVLGLVRKRRPDRILIAGDVVGYGANPNECMEIIEHLDATIVMGNHDEAVSNVTLRTSFSDSARVAIEWTANVLEEKHQKTIAGWTRFVTDTENNWTLFHGSAKDPQEYRYVYYSDHAADSFQCFKTTVSFFGHTHLPSIFTLSGQGAYLPAGKHRIDPKDQCMINPGSVGQPRDKNRQSSFAFYDSNAQEIEIIRTDYDNQSAAAKIRKAGLPEFLAERLI